MTGASGKPDRAGGLRPERWLPVTSFEGCYEVSDLGRVRSCDRVTRCVNSGRQRTQTFRGRLLAPTFDKCGYPSVNLCRDGRSRRNSVHRLVCEAFHGAAPFGHEVAHRNGVRSDCRAENLKWATKAENESHKAIHREGGVV